MVFQDAREKDTDEKDRPLAYQCDSDTRHLIPHQESLKMQYGADPIKG